MEKLNVTLKTVTPMFLGGAEQNASTELRAPSIKGVLRFWHRAIAPSCRQIESEIFGSTDTGQSSFILQVKGNKIIEGKKGDSKWDGKKTPYLGFGLINKDSKIKKTITVRPYIATGSEFEISIIFNKRANDIAKASVERALWAFLMFGGLGARSRRGFGSLQVVDIIGDALKLPWRFEKIEAFATAVKDFCAQLTMSSELPEYTCFSEGCRIALTPKYGDGETALEQLATKFNAFRSFKGDKLFIPDHDLLATYLRTGNIDKAPIRAAFGLPHNYFFTTALPRVVGEVNFMNNKQKGRRASPLLLHIQGLGKEACGVATFLPARLIPKDKQVTISGNQQRPVVLSLPDDFSALTQFIDVLKNTGQEVTW